MNIIFDFEKLKALLAHFYALSGVRYSLFDMDNNILCASNDISPFCSLINAVPEGHLRCRASDARAFMQAKSITSAAYVYTCHAGLVEACIPILVSGEIIAYVFLGQALGEGEVLPQWEAALPQLGWYSDLAQLRRAFFSQKQLSRAVILACTELLRMCTSYIWLEGVVSMGALSDSQRLYSYINANFAQKLTLDKISCDLATGKTKLCAIAAKQHTTITGMITHKRISVAKTYLENTDLFIGEIASMVGISDYNYFSKIFKEQTGLTPKQYRKLHLNESP